MITEPEKLVASIVAATEDHRLVSRIRLQKIAYLLKQLGGPVDFEFSYHHYGPYSRELDNAVVFALAFGLIDEEQKNRMSDGASYSVFSVNADQSIDPLDEQFQDQVRELAKSKVTVLELAATAHWLAKVERVDDWRSEIVKRKGRKTEDGRLDEALELLSQLHLQPAEGMA